MQSFPNLGLGSEAGPTRGRAPRALLASRTIEMRKHSEVSRELQTRFCCRSVDQLGISWNAVFAVSVDFLK